MNERIIARECNTNDVQLIHSNAYHVDYIKSNEEYFILKRLKDNKILHVFPKNIGFIVQNNSDGKVNFLVGVIPTDAYSDIVLEHYVDYGESELTLKSTNVIDSNVYSDIKITDNSFLVKGPGNGSSIYNLNARSDEYDKIFNDQALNKYIPENTVLVKKQYYAFLRRDIEDTVYFGINPETFEITTPIWSELQQRMINVYTYEEVEKLNKKLHEEGKYLTTLSSNRLTLAFEVENYLSLLSSYIDEPNSVYKGYNDINEEFVRKFKPKN